MEKVVVHISFPQFIFSDIIQQGSDTPIHTPESFLEKSTHTKRLQPSNAQNLFSILRACEKERTSSSQINGNVSLNEAWGMRTKALFSFSVRCVWWTLRTKRPWTFICEVMAQSRPNFSSVWPRIWFGGSSAEGCDCGVENCFCCGK